MESVHNVSQQYLLDRTVRTYREHFEEFRAKMRPNITDEFKAWVDTFAGYVPPNGNIFELGSGTGRDARYFAAKGYSVTCTDVVAEALAELAHDGFDTAEYDFRNDPLPHWLGAYDGYFANSVLLHAPSGILENAIANSAHILKPGGVAGLSFKLGNGTAIDTKKMGAPRYFNYQSEERIRTLLSQSPFTIRNVLFLDHPVPGEHPFMYVIAQRE